jgi:hypothetical protein
MTRKPSDIVSPNLRIREDLRRRLEKAAAENGVSINREMINRLGMSFDRESLFTLGRITQDQEQFWARYGAALFDLELQGDLIRDAETLLAALPVEVIASSAVAPTVTRLTTTIRAIDDGWQKFGRRLHAI